MSDNRHYKRRVRGSYITSTLSISLVLFMLGMLGLLLLNAHKLSNYVKENIGFTVFINEGSREIDIIQLEKGIDASRYVKTTEYITAEKAAEKLQQQLGEDFVDFLGYNPLLASIEVHMKADYANNDSLAVIEKELQQSTLVKEVVYEKSLIHLVNENVQKIGLIILIVVLVLSLIAITLINSTIRLSIHSKRFIIRTMQLVGATNGFIRQPFLNKSLLQGFIASFISIAFLAMFIYFVQQLLQGILLLPDIKMQGTLFGGIILLGLLINYIFTFFAVTKYLNIKQDDLY